MKHARNTQENNLSTTKDGVMSIENSLDDAFNNRIKTLYNTFSQAILTAAGDSEQLTAAKNRFQKGLAHEKAARDIAHQLAGLSNGDQPSNA